MKQLIELNENKLREMVAEKLKSIIIEHNNLSKLYYPEKIIYYPEDGALGGDMGYDFLDKGELGNDNPNIIMDGIIDYLINDYPTEKEELCDWVVVLYLGHGSNRPEKLYISSLDKEFANDISVASEKFFGVKIPVEIIGNVTNECKKVVKIDEAVIRKIITESMKSVLKEMSDAEMIHNEQELEDYFYNYCERYYDRIVSSDSLETEFYGNGVFMGTPVLTFDITEDDAFELFKIAFGKVNSDYHHYNEN